MDIRKEQVWYLGLALAAIIVGMTVSGRGSLRVETPVVTVTYDSQESFGAGYQAAVKALGRAVCN